MSATPQLFLGTQGWSYSDWLGNFYPPGCRFADFLEEYAKHFTTVEIDSTFYRIPSQALVRSWKERTPDGFVFSAKFPQIITHEKALETCEEEVAAFLKAMEGLGDKLGPLLLQFPYGFRWTELPRLTSFLQALPTVRYAVEVRHRSWLKEEFFKLLESLNVAFALIDHPWMPKSERTTAGFVYIRWLGDRKKIPEDFSHIRIDRSKELAWWAEKVRGMLERGLTMYGYFNNHYAGHSPSSLRQFSALLSRSAKE